MLHQQVNPWTGARTSYSSAQLASGLVLIDGRVLPTRPVDGAYALVRLEDAPGVSVFLQGQDMGRTGSGGDLLVTGLQPYLGNRISIRDSDLPLDFRVDEVERVVAPSQRGGSVERFRVARQLSVAGRILLEVDGRGTPARVGRGGRRGARPPAVSPIGHGGAFWLEGIPPARHDALVRWEGRLCRFTFEVAPDGGGDRGPRRASAARISSRALLGSFARRCRDQYRYPCAMGSRRPSPKAFSRDLQHRRRLPPLVLARRSPSGARAAPSPPGARARRSSSSGSRSSTYAREDVVEHLVGRQRVLVDLVRA